MGRWILAGLLSRKTMDNEKLEARIIRLEKSLALAGIALYEEPVITVTEPELPKATATDVRINSVSGLHFCRFKYLCECGEKHESNVMIPDGSRYHITMKITPEESETSCTLTSQVFIEWAKPMF
jgi:hypothetical protein